jgi:hypothetical protein
MSGARRIFKDDPERGLKIFWESTPEGFVLHYEQDAEPILESNKTKQSMGRSYYARDPDMWKAASIPIGVAYKWLTEFGVDVYNDDHWPGVRRLLNDPEWRYLKTADIII